MECVRVSEHRTSEISKLCPTTVILTALKSPILLMILFTFPVEIIRRRGISIMSKHTIRNFVELPSCHTPSFCLRAVGHYAYISGFSQNRLRMVAGHLIMLIELLPST